MGVQTMGCLANITTLDLPVNYTWGKLVRDFNLISIISKLLIPGMAQDDLILEVLLLVTAITMDAQVVLRVSRLQ